MRIISKQKDYYEIGLKYGIDPDCKYIRKTDFGLSSSVIGEKLFNKINSVIKPFNMINFEVNNKKRNFYGAIINAG